MGTHPRRTLQDSLLERAAAALVDILLGEATFGGGDLGNRLRQSTLLRLATVEDTGFIEMNVRIDEAGNDQPAAGILNRRIGRDTRRNLDDPALRDSDIDHIIAFGNTRLMKDEIERHGFRTLRASAHGHDVTAPVNAHAQVIRRRSGSYHVQLNREFSMFYALLYVCILLPFCLLDGVWLTVMGNLMYKPTLGDILLPTLNGPPAVAFYLIFGVGILVFAALPAVKAGSVGPALIYGALFGAIAYATYDLTNYATLRNWTLLISVLDIAWGAFASAIAAGASFYAIKTIGPWFGIAAN